MKINTIQCEMSLILCLLILVSCSTNDKPNKNVNRTDGSKNCYYMGNTHTTSSISTFPSTQGNWPMFHNNISRDGSTSAGEGSKIILAWSYCTTSSIFSSSVVENGIVYISSTDKTLTAIDIRSEKVLWRFQADRAFYGTPSVLNGILYAASVGGSIYAIDSKNGFVHWHVHIDDSNARIWSSPGVANGIVIIGLASVLSEIPKVSGQLIALDARTGKLRWKTYTQSGGEAGGGIWSSPAIDVVNNIVYIGTGDPDDGVEALNLLNGHIIWHWRSVTQDVEDTDIGAGPLLYQSSKQLRVCVGGKDGYIYSLDAKTGYFIWKTRVGERVYSSPTFANGMLYTVGDTNPEASLWALNAQTGKPIWKHSISTTVLSSPAIVGKILYLSIGDNFDQGDGGIEVINDMSGQRMQYVDLHSAVTSSPAVLSSWVFVGANNGNLYAFIRLKN